MNTPVVSRDEWLAARLALLAQEKELTRTRDELSRVRRVLPRVRVDKNDTFDTDDGARTLAGLFDGRSRFGLGANPEALFNTLPQYRTRPAPRSPDLPLEGRFSAAGRRHRRWRRGCRRRRAAGVVVAAGVEAVAAAVGLAGRAAGTASALNGTGARQESGSFQGPLSRYAQKRNVFGRGAVSPRSTDSI
jgi:hypothetical protein